MLNDTRGRLYIARSKSTHLHSAIWVIEKSFYDEPILGIDADSFDRLLRAKNAEMLLQVMDGLCPLTRKDGAGDAKISRVFEIPEFEKRYGKDFEKSSAGMLVRETFLFPFAQAVNVGDEGGVFDFELKANKSAAARAVSSYDAQKRGLGEYLAKLSNRDDYLVCVEPLQNWMFVRNMLSLAALMYSASMSASGASLSSHPLFQRVDKHWLIGQPCLIAPVVFNAYWRVDSTAAGMAENLKPATVREAISLFDAATREPEWREKRLLAMPFNYCVLVGGNNNVLFMSFPLATKQGFGAKKAADVKDMNTYIVLPVGEFRSELDVASGVFDEIYRAVFNNPEITSGKTLAGAAMSSGVEIDGESRLNFDSLIAALWDVLEHHKGYQLITCEWCGNTTLVSSMGRRPRYCSVNCRNQAGKAQS